MVKENYRLERTETGAVTLSISAEPLNILTSLMLDQLSTIITELAEDETIRCLIIGGGERAFIGGANIKEMVDFDSESAAIFIRKIAELCEQIRQFPVPVIAKIEGWTFGAGVELLAACDIRIASDNANFAMPEVRLGIPSVVHAALLPNLIGSGNTRWWLLTGDSINADRALSWGLITIKTSSNQLQNEVDRVVNSILECQPLAIRAQKRLLNHWDESTLSESIESSIAVFARSYKTNEPRRAMMSFLNKEK